MSVIDNPWGFTCFSEDSFLLTRDSLWCSETLFSFKYMSEGEEESSVTGLA